MAQIKLGHVLWLAGMVFTLVVTSVSGVWMLSESRKDDLSSIEQRMQGIDTRLARIEGFLNVQQKPLLAADIYNIKHNTEYNR